MKSLFEELKLYEEMWEESKPLTEEEKTFRSEYARLWSTPEGREQYKNLPLETRLQLSKEDREADPVYKTLDTTPDFDLEYDGFADEWCKDHFDPGSWYGHYQTCGTNHYSDFVYSVDAQSMFETLRDTIIPMHGKLGMDELLDNYLNMEKVWEDAEGAEADALEEELDLLLAKNLDHIFEMFVEEITAHYYDDAYEWAREHLDPDYD